MNINKQEPKLPTAEVYEEECDMLPWAKLLQKAANWVINNAGSGSYVVDYMCGTGRVLYDISQQRKDLFLAGCTLEPKSYIDFAEKRSPEINFKYQDAFQFVLEHQPNIAICTGGIHHLPRDQQELFIEQVSKNLTESGYFLVGEQVISSAVCEKERKKATVELFSNMASWCIDKNVSDSVLDAVIDILRNDLFEAGEYKIDIKTLIKILSNKFLIEDVYQIWPDSHQKESFGDYFLVCKKKN